MNEHKWQPIETTPKDRPILAVWGTVASGPMGYDIIKHWRDDIFRSENGGDRYPAEGFCILGWMALPEFDAQNK